MTCIAAVKHDNRIFIGGDSAGVAGYSLSIRSDTKVFSKLDADKNTWVFGFTSSFRMGQLLHYNLSLPPVTQDTNDLHKFMVTKFVPALQGCLSSGGYQENDKGKLSGGTFIVGVRSELFIIEGDYQVALPENPYAAVGSGAQAALGSLFTTQQQKHKPKQRILLALSAAEHCNAGVHAPFSVIST